MIFRSDNPRSRADRAGQHHSRFISTAEGSALIEMGNTRVICTASVEERCLRLCAAPARDGSLASTGCCPRSTLTRSTREAAKGKQSGRTQEIQR